MKYARSDNTDVGLDNVIAAAGVSDICKKIVAKDICPDTCEKMNADDTRLAVEIFENRISFVIIWIDPGFESKSAARANVQTWIAVDSQHIINIVNKKTLSDFANRKASTVEKCAVVRVAGNVVGIAVARQPRDDAGWRREAAGRSGRRYGCRGWSCRWCRR